MCLVLLYQINVFFSFNFFLLSMVLSSNTQKAILNLKLYQPFYSKLLTSQQKKKTNPSHFKIPNTFQNLKIHAHTKISETMQGINRPLSVAVGRPFDSILSRFSVALPTPHLTWYVVSVLIESPAICEVAWLANVVLSCPDKRKGFVIVIVQCCRNFDMNGFFGL